MARTDNLTNFLTDVADAIRDKKGTTMSIAASSFDTEIKNISTAEDLTNEFNDYEAYLTEQETTIDDIMTALQGKGTGNGITPTGTLDITENGSYDVTNYASVNVNVPSVQDTSIEDALANRTITSFSSNVTSIGSYAFHSCTKLTSVDLLNATSLGSSAFNNCTAMTSIQIPLVQSISTQTFYSCNSLATLNMPSLKTISSQGARNCTKLTKVDLGVCTSIGALSFDGCSLLDTVILRTATVCNLVNTSAFTGTLIADGTGYIYVPDELVEDYKVATNWSTYASQIKGLSELVE